MVIIVRGRRELVNECLLRYQEWLENSRGWVLEDLKTLQKLSPDKFEQQLQERFGVDAEFGTGGLRQIIRAGTNGFNDPWITRICLGVSCIAKSVVIAYDTRLRSRYFALLAAKVLSSQGIKAYVFDTATPTPVLSFAVRYMKCTAGIAITASHNQALYNGLKVYDSRGVQMVPDRIETLKEKINTFDFFEKVPETFSFDLIGNEIKNAYMHAVLTENHRYDSHTDRRLTVLYTPIHGTGVYYIPELLAMTGFECRVVEQQRDPDPAFPTVTYPNPEDPDSFRIALTESVGISPKPELIIATDPDADRLGIYLLSGKSYVSINGNEIGILLTDFLVRSLKRDSVEPYNTNKVVLKTIVTSDLLASYAEKNGLLLKETLTGFKYLGDQIEQLDEKKESFLCAFEESYGFLHGSHARDKDALSTALLFCLLLRSEGTAEKILTRLREIYQEYGFHKEGTISIELDGTTGQRKIARFMAYLRKYPNQDVLGSPVVSYKDYGKETNLQLVADVVSFIFENGTRAIYRPSGTEPKLKVYLYAVSDTENGSNERYMRLSEKIKQANARILEGIAREN
jgi:phosphoglucomutase